MIGTTYFFKVMVIMKDSQKDASAIDTTEQKVIEDDYPDIDRVNVYKINKEKVEKVLKVKN